MSDGWWSVSPVDRSHDPETFARNLPLHRGLTEDGRALLAEGGFAQVASWQHLFGFNPYPADVPFFVLFGVPRRPTGAEPSLRPTFRPEARAGASGLRGSRSRDSPTPFRWRSDPPCAAARP